MDFRSEVRKGNHLLESMDTKAKVTLEIAEDALKRVERIDV
jgi:hypothetical protein